jgi:thioredoxin reductase
MASTISPSTYEQHRRDVLPKLEKQNVHFYPAYQLSGIEENSIALRSTRTGELLELEADSVVLAVGVKPVKSLYDELSSTLDRVYKVGDANQAGRIANATQDAYQVAIKIM